MWEKRSSGYFIAETNLYQTDKDNQIISKNTQYQVSPSLPSETLESALKKQEELNNSRNTISSNIILSNSNIWDEVWENIDTYLENFLKEIQKQRKISTNTIKNMNSGFNYLKLFCVKGIVPDLQFYKYVQNSMEMLPKNFLRGKEWKKVSIADIKKNVGSSNYEKLDAQTINKHLNFHKQFFAWLEYNHEKYNTNIDKLIPLFEENEVAKVEYSEKDLRAIFDYDLKEDCRDFFSIALYTGMRMSEICSLKSSNIIDNCIKVFDGKTKNAVRIIPLHINIKKIVLDRAKNTTDSGHLIFNGNSSAIGKKLNRTLNKIILDKDKSLHSFRKNFSQAMEEVEVGEEKYKDYLMGHSISSVRQKHYNLGKINVDKLREIINNIVINY
ncbi:MAG: tyrosine-type recombinase/integrase [Sulfurimonas sp.]